MSDRRVIQVTWNRKLPRKWSSLFGFWPLSLLFLSIGLSGCTSLISIGQSPVCDAASENTECGGINIAETDTQMCHAVFANLKRMDSAERKKYLCNNNTVLLARNNDNGDKFLGGGYRIIEPHSNSNLVEDVSEDTPVNLPVGSSNALEPNEVELGSRLVVSTDTQFQESELALTTGLTFEPVEIPLPGPYRPQFDSVGSIHEIHRIFGDIDILVDRKTEAPFTGSVYTYNQSPMVYIDKPNPIQSADIAQEWINRVGILIRNDGVGRNRGLCTGTLVNRKYVLTAAHCFFEPSPHWADKGDRRTDLPKQEFCFISFAINLSDVADVLTVENLEYFINAKVSAAAPCFKQSGRLLESKSQKDDLVRTARRLSAKLKNEWRFHLHGMDPVKIRSVELCDKYALRKFPPIVRDYLTSRRFDSGVNGSYLLSSSLVLRCDIAVVELDHASSYKDPLYLKVGTTTLTNGLIERRSRKTLDLTLLGYGNTGELGRDNDAGILRWTTVPRLNFAKDYIGRNLGAEKLEALRKWLTTDNVLWANNRQNKSKAANFVLPEQFTPTSEGTACPGDSGGPIFQELQDGSSLLVGVVSSSTLDSCAPPRWARYDSQLIEYAWGSAVSSLRCDDKLQSAKICEKLLGRPANLVISGKRDLSFSDKKQCRWYIPGKFPKSFDVRPFALFDSPSQRLHNYRLCSKLPSSEIAELNMSLNGVLGPGFDPWIRNPEPEFDINLYSRIPMSWGTDFQDSKLSNRYLGIDFYGAKGRSPAESVLDCNSSSTGTHESCNFSATDLASVKQQNCEMVDADDCARSNIPIVVERLNYHGEYLLQITTKTKE